MGIKFNCPQGHKLHVKSFLAGKRGICPHCNVKFRIPIESGGVAEPVKSKESVETGVMSADPVAAQPSGHAQAATHAGVASPVAQPTYNGAGPVAAAVSATSAQAPYASPGVVAAAPVAAAPAAASDPLTESPHALWYVRPRSGGQFGPAAADIMRQWLGEGRVAADTLVWREGWADWQQASSVFSQLAATAAPSFQAPAAAVVSADFSGPQAQAAPEAARSSRPVTPRRKSNDLTILLVMLLVVVAIVLAVVFVFVLQKQGTPAAAAGGVAPPVAAVATADLALPAAFSPSANLTL